MPAALSNLNLNTVSLNSAPYLFAVNEIVSAPTNPVTVPSSDTAFTPPAVTVPAVVSASALKIPFFKDTFTSAGAPVAELSSCFAFAIKSSISSCVYTLFFERFKVNVFPSAAQIAVS